MTFLQLKEKYLNYIGSPSIKDKMRAKGYLQIMKMYSQLESSEYYDEVRVSLAAEEYLKTAKIKYSSSKKEEYKWHIRAAYDCIIKYVSDTALAAELSLYEGILDVPSVFEFLSKTSYKGRVKYESVKSLCAVMNLPVEEQVEAPKK